MNKILAVMVALGASASGVGCSGIARYAVDETKEALVSYMKDEALPALKEQVNSYLDQKIKEQEAKETEKLNLALAEFDSTNAETGITEAKRTKDFDLNANGSLEVPELAAIGKYIAVKRAGGHGTNAALTGGAAALAALAALGAGKAAKNKYAKKPPIPPPVPEMRV